MAPVFTKILFLATLFPFTNGYPNGAPNCNDGNAAIGQGSYHDAPRGLLSNLGIAVCMDGININTNDTFHAEPNSTYTLTLQRSMNGGIEGIFVRFASMDMTVSESVELDTVLTTTNTLLQASTFCSASATGLTHTNKDRKPAIEITIDTTGLPIGSEYGLGITSVDHHDHAYASYTIHIMDGKNHSTMATNGTCQAVEATSGVNSVVFSSNPFFTLLLTVVGFISTLVAL
jgi:hypothetical protein